MRAPEKIYMPNELLSEEWQRHIEGQDTEYIRQDVLVKKLEEQKEAFLESAFEFFENSLCCYVSAQQFGIQEERLKKDFRYSIEYMLKNDFDK